MSKKYKQAMDQLTVSDELKAKILQTAAEKANQKTKRTTLRISVRRAAVCAAALIICVSAALLTQNYTTSNIVPMPTKAPESPMPTASAAVFPTASPFPAVQPPTDERRTEAILPQVTPNPAATPQPEHTEKPQATLPPSEEPQPGANDEPPKATAPNTGAENDSPEQGGAPNQGGMQSGGILDLDSIDELRRAAGYDFKLPQQVPTGYYAEMPSLLFGTLVQVLYTNGEDELFYRTERSEEDISGDYNVYESVVTESCNGFDVTLKGNGDRVFCAVWVDGDAYAIYSREGLAKQTMLAMIASVN